MLAPSVQGLIASRCLARWITGEGGTEASKAGVFSLVSLVSG